MNAEEVVVSTGEPAFAVDSRGRIVAWNEAAECFFGYRRNEVVGKKGWEVLRGEDVFSNPYCSERCPLLDRILTGARVHPTKLVFRDALGSKRLARVSLLLVPGKEPQDKQVVHLVQPLGSLHEAEATTPTAHETVNNNSRLTPRELEVLSQLGDASSTRQIAEFLCVSRSTVLNHIQSILAKLKVHSRLEAVVLARRIGLL